MHVHFFPSQSSALFNPITKKITTVSQSLPSHFSIKEKRKWNENPKVVLVHSPPCKGRALVLSVKLKAFILPPTHTFHHHQIIGREIKEKLNMFIKKNPNQSRVKEWEIMGVLGFGFLGLFLVFCWLSCAFPFFLLH